MRHAQATRISVHLRYERDALSLSVHDNGRGFHATNGAAFLRGHFGIRVMEERTRKLGGAFRLQTSIGSGTKVTIRVPFEAMQRTVKQNDHFMRWMRA